MVRKNVKNLFSESYRFSNGVGQLDPNKFTKWPLCQIIEIWIHLNLKTRYLSHNLCVSKLGGCGWMDPGVELPDKIQDAQLNLSFRSTHWFFFFSVSLPHTIFGIYLYWKENLCLWYLNSAVLPEFLFAKSCNIPEVFYKAPPCPWTWLASLQNALWIIQCSIFIKYGESVSTEWCLLWFDFLLNFHLIFKSFSDQTITFSMMSLANF